MKIRRERHRVWSLSYHAVFVVKYRKPCITDEIADFLLDEMRHLLESWGGELIEGKADRDHLHLLFSLPPEAVFPEQHVLSINQYVLSISQYVLSISLHGL